MVVVVVVVLVVVVVVPQRTCKTGESLCRRKAAKMVSETRTKVRARTKARRPRQQSRAASPTCCHTRLRPRTPVFNCGSSNSTNARFNGVWLAACASLGGACGRSWSLRAMT